MSTVSNQLNGKTDESEKTWNVEGLPQFPLETLLPKKDTQQEALLAKFPEYDGRGILIAILDTGVDPALPGMQVTTTGERKMVDCIDCSGSGDVDTSTVKTAVNGVVDGLTGRKLKIPEGWVNPSGKFHLGVKAIHELYPTTLLKTITNERRDEVWKSSHQMAMADTLRQMTSHEEAVGGTSDKLKEKLEREDLASKIEFLRSADTFVDKGPVADVIVWNDGKSWKACLDTSFRGRLNLCKVMGSFKETGEFDKLTERDAATYTFRIDPSGKLVEICVANGSHGSHVANIAAAHFPNEPKKNGLAPGAKVISLSIGDNRLGSMETGTALIRAINLCAEYKVDVVNMSFGEGTHIPNKGRVIEELQYLAERHKVTLVMSGGNNGPALSTVGAPGGTTSHIIGVAAFLTKEMADPLYGVFNEINGNLYPWSSRGPCTDGWLGVSLCAPGAALTGVPKYTRKSGQMMNGTSMSSPNAAGSIACFLSGLKTKNITWTPYQVRVALENTAKKVQGLDSFAQGQGMIQILDALNYFDKAGGAFLTEDLTQFDVKVSQGGVSGRGVYLRETCDMKTQQEFVVSVAPKFAETLDVSPEHAIDFECNMVLKCDSPWISVPSSFAAVAQARTFFMMVDPTELDEGKEHYTEVLGFDSRRPDLGPLFRVPITVVKPEVFEDNDHHKEYNFNTNAGVPVRRYITVPQFATACEVKVTNLMKIPQDRFVLHAVYLESDKCYRNCEAYKTLGPDGHEWRECFAVKEGRTLEVCLARSWTRDSNPAKVRMEVTFHGIRRHSPELVLIHGAGSTEFRATCAPFKPEKINPTIKFNAMVNALKPSSAKLEPLGAKDILSRGLQVHRLILTYNVSVSKTAECQFEIPGVSQYLYENLFDCLLIHVYTAGKELVGSSSSYHDRYTIKLEKGEYTIRAQLRSPTESLLNKIRDTPLHVHTKVTDLSLPIHSSPSQQFGVGTGRKLDKATLAAGEQVAMYVGSLADDKLPKALPLTSGSYLLGRCSMFQDVKCSVADKSSVKYLFTEYSARPSTALSMVTLKDKVEKDQNVEMQEALRDMQIQWLEKLKDEVAANQLYVELVDKWPNHLPLLISKLKMLEKKKNRSATEEDHLSMIVQQVAEICQPAELLQYLGARNEYREDDLALKRTMNERKSALIDSLAVWANVVLDKYLKVSTEFVPKMFRQGIAAAEVKAEKTDGTNKETKETSEKAEDIVNTGAEAEKTDAPRVTRKDAADAYANLIKWIAPDDVKVQVISAKHAAAHGHLGLTLKYLWKHVEDGRATGKDTKEIEKAVAEICDMLGWNYIANHLRNEILVRHRDSYRIF